MTGQKRISHRKLNETAIGFILMFDDHGSIVRLDGVSGIHTIDHLGEHREFRTNREAYNYMVRAMEEYEMFAR